MGQTRTGAPARGIEQPMHPSVTGSIVGMAGASAFMLISRPELPAPVQAPVLVTWIVLVAATAWTVLLRRRVFPDLPPPRRAAGLVYSLSVTGAAAALWGAPWGAVSAVAAGVVMFLVVMLEAARTRR